MLNNVATSNKAFNVTGSGGGAVCRIVVSDIRGPGFESSHHHFFLKIYFLLTVEKTKIKKKRKRMAN